MNWQNKPAFRFSLRDILWLTEICGLLVAIFVTWRENSRLENETGRILRADKFGPQIVDGLRAYEQLIGEEVQFERDSQGRLQAVTKNGDRMYWEYPKGGPVERVVTDENGETTRTRVGD